MSIPVNLEQQRKIAKELIRAARDGDLAALGRLQAVRSDIADRARPLKLADAQLAVARESGFDSWPKLVAHFHEQDTAAFRDAVTSGDVPLARQLLASAHVQKAINAPMFGAMPHNTDATVNHTSPATNMRLRPYSSPSAPPRRSSALNVKR